MSNDAPVNPSPEEIALWLAIVDTEHAARVMASAEAPPEIVAIDVFVDGSPLDPDDYVPEGTTVDVEVTATNCGEITLEVPGSRQSLRARATDVGAESQAFSFSFPVFESGPARLSAINAFGESQPPAQSGSAHEPKFNVHAIPRPARNLFEFADFKVDVLDDAAIEHLARTWQRHREYALDFDSAEYALAQRTVSEYCRAADDPAFTTSVWATRLRDVLTAHQVMTDAATQAMVGRPRLDPPMRVPSVPRLVRDPSYGRMGRR